MFDQLFIVVIALVTASTDVENAPRDTLDPAKSTGQLIDIFSNCEFSAKQTSQSDPPHGTGYIINTEMTAWICRDATLLRTRNRTRIYGAESKVGVGDPEEDNNESVETRWTRGGSRMQSHIQFIGGPGSNRWPGGTVPFEVMNFNAVLDYPPSDSDSIVMWDGLLIGDFVGDVDLVSGMTLADMVTIGGGRHGYRLESVTWAQKDHSAVAYRFASSTFGSCTATFTRINENWMPTQFEIVRTANDRAYVAASDVDNRLINDKAYTDFSPSATGLDRLETAYKITYDQLPTSITKIERRYYRGRESVATDQLVFGQLLAGGVTLEKIHQAMLPIPNGTEVLPTDEARKPLQWVMQDGEVVKHIDPLGEQIGSLVKFSSTRRMGIVMTSIVIAILAAIVIYRRISETQ